MILPQYPDNEPFRLREVYKTRLLDSPPEAEFDEIVKLASTLCDAPISLITILDTHRQWFKSRLGLDVAETERDFSFCGHAILQEDIFEIPDALADDRFFDNPLVTGEPNIRFYAGVPLVTQTGGKLGTLCVIDRLPRILNETQKFAMKVLASNIMKIAELRMKNEALQNVTDSQKQVIAILAHDVRNPLASIKSIIDLKNEDYLDEAASVEMLGLVSKQLDSTLTMVDNVVNWGQLLLKQQASSPQATNLNQLVNDVLAADYLAAKMKHNQLINEVDEDILIYHDKQAVTFILRNLVTNAIKFTTKGTITVKAKELDGQVEIIIADTGIGMSAKKRDQLFTHASQLSTLGTNNEKGSGLGLMLVKEFINQFCGTIKVESLPGEGSKFILTL